MAMTKKEIAAHAEELAHWKLRAALFWTPEVKPDLLPPTAAGALTRGFMHGTSACSSSVFHSSYRDDKTTSQNSKSIYSTKLLSLQAMRHEIEVECANKLLEIDRRIEEERAKA